MDFSAHIMHGLDWPTRPFPTNFRSLRIFVSAPNQLLMTLLSSPPSPVISDSPAAPLMICLTCRLRISDSDFCQIFGFSLKSSRIIASQRISVYSSVILDCPRLVNYARTFLSTLLFSTILFAEMLFYEHRRS